MTRNKGLWGSPKPFRDKIYRGLSASLYDAQKGLYEPLGLYDAIHYAMEILAAVHKYSLVYKDGRFSCDGWEVFVLMNGYTIYIATHVDAPKGYCWPLAYGATMMNDLFYIAELYLKDFDESKMEANK